MNVLLDKYMPLKKVSQKEFKRKYKPWITDKIIRNIVIKNRIFKKCIKCKNHDQKSHLNVQFKLLQK